MSRCFICPRKCGADRTKEKGFCGAGEDIIVSKIMVHRDEEPIISGTRGSGAVFFGGCNLRCVFCQNAPISRGGVGTPMTQDELFDKIIELIEQGVHNVDFITAGHYVPMLVPMLERLRKVTDIPFVYNSGGYENTETLKVLDGLIDVYLPDFKYCSGELSKKFSAAPDYREVAEKAIGEMLRQRGKAIIDGGLIKSGVVIRHLVLPSHRDDSIAVMRIIAEKFGDAKVSIMRQYTPCFNQSEFPELNRRVTSFEYDIVVEEAIKLGLDGYTQDKGCATAEFTPDFDDTY